MKKNIFYSMVLFSGICVFILSASTNYNSAASDPGISISFSDTVKREPFLAPAWADTVRNPLTISSATISQGEELFNMYCFSCHGDTGYGDGPAGGSMPISPANFHDQKVIKQKDGALFWKLTNGKGNMPPFKEILTEQQRWQMIIYLRELGKQN